MTAPRTILVVDDAAEIRSLLTSALSMDAAYRVRTTGTVTEAAAMVLGRDSRIDAILLDVQLPDGDGRDLCLRLRQHGVRIPIIMLTGATSEADVVAGLDSGANDYIAKPFRLGELLARLRSQFRTFEASDDVAYRIGSFLFRPAARVLQDRVGNRRVRLTDKEASVLRYLCRAEGQPVSRQTLLREVWGYSPAADSHTVETHIYRLRRKIEPEPGQIRLLTNVGGGYRLAEEEVETAIAPRRILEPVRHAA